MAAGVMHVQLVDGRTCVVSCLVVRFIFNIIQIKPETLYFGGRDLKKTQNFRVRAYSPVHIFEVTVQVCSD